MAIQKEKTVKIKLFKDQGRYKNDVFVGLNGRTFLIKRGVEVEVPEGVAEILKHQEEQDAVATMMMEDLQKDGNWDETKQP